MQKEILLNNGVKIPTPGFGTFLTPDGATCVEAVKSAIAAGYTHIDTAAIYKNEKSVGEGIKESGIKRDDLFVTSKVWNTERGYDKTLKAFDKTLNHPLACQQFAIWFGCRQLEYGDMESHGASA